MNRFVRTSPVLSTLLLASPAVLAAPDIEIMGRVHLDYAVYDDDVADLGDGGELRRGRLGAQGNLAEAWKYKVEYDFAGGESTLKDAYLTYSGLGPGELKIGQFKQRMSLSNLTSSKYGTFMERALPTAFVFGYGPGLGYTWNGPKHSIQIGGYGQDLNDSRDDEGLGVNLRTTWTPVREDRRVVHLGAAIAREQAPDKTDTVRFRARPESHVTDVRLVDTGTIDGVNSLTRTGVEAAWVQGPWSVQGEYLQVDVDRDGRDFRGSGWYVYGSWILTGESRPYGAEGNFGRLRPDNPRGAWELALRYSEIDLDDNDFNGGEEENITLAVNYYATSHLRFQLNVSDVKSTRAGMDDDPGIVQMRVGFDF